MVGTFPVAGALTLEELGYTLTTHELQGFTQVTALTISPTKKANLVTMIDQMNQLGALVVVPQGAASDGTKVLSTEVYVQDVKTAVDLYRLAL